MEDKEVIIEVLPSYYKQIYADNLDIIQNVFDNFDENQTQNENCGTAKLPENLLQFLNVISDVFSLSDKPCDTHDIVGVGDNSPILYLCVKRFSEVFRQGFRGVKYLTPGRFSETANRAEIESIKLLYNFYEECGMNSATDEKEVKLGSIITLERCWIEIVNENRRRKDLQVIMSECVDKFKDVVRKEFGYLYLSDEDLNYVYCEERILETQVQEMIFKAKENFRNQIPFEEDERILQNLCVEFEREIKENVSDDLIRRNCVQRQVVRDKMDVMVEHAVEIYIEKMAKYLEKQARFIRDSLMEEHERVKNEVMPMFVNGGDRVPNEIGTHEYQVCCWNRFNDKVYDSFKTLMSQAIGNGKEKLDTCEKRTVKEIVKSLEVISEILKEYGLDSFVPDLHSNLEINLSKIFDYARDENKVTYNCLIQDVKPIRLLTERERLSQNQNLANIEENIVSMQLERVDAGTNTELKKKMGIFGKPLQWIRHIWTRIRFYFCFGVVPTISNWRRRRCCA